MNQQSNLEEEINKLKDPISGPYYFYLNYVIVTDKEGNELVKLTEEQFNHQFKLLSNPELCFKSRRRRGR